MLDLVILSPVWGLTVYRLLEQSSGGIPIAEQVLQSPEQKSAMWFWLRAIIGAVFALYAASDANHRSADLCTTYLTSPNQ